jgi:streptogramin lyase
MTRTPASTKPIIREHRIPTPDSGPYIVVEGPDGNLWFCESRAGKIGCFNPDTGAFREFPLPDRDCMPIGIALGVDRNLWFTEKQANRVGRITVDGTIAEFARRPRKPHPMELRLGLTVISGFPKATLIASRASPATAASANLV